MRRWCLLSSNEPGPTSQPASQSGGEGGEEYQDQDGISSPLKSSGCAPRYLVRAMGGLSDHVTLMSPSQQTLWVNTWHHHHNSPPHSLPLPLSLSPFLARHSIYRFPPLRRKKVVEESFIKFSKPWSWGSEEPTDTGQMRGITAVRNIQCLCWLQISS